MRIAARGHMGAEGEEEEGGEVGVGNLYKGVKRRGTDTGGREGDKGGGEMGDLVIASG